MIALRVLVAVPNYHIEVAEWDLLRWLLIALVVAVGIVWGIVVIGRAISRRSAHTRGLAMPLGWGPVAKRYAGAASLAVLPLLVHIAPVFVMMMYDCGDWLWWLWCAVLA